jgi:hypothetical protein
LSAGTAKSIDMICVEAFGRAPGTVNLAERERAIYLGEY